MLEINTAPLSGSEKQQLWARKIRNRIIDRISNIRNFDPQKYTAESGFEEGTDGFNAEVKINEKIKENANIFADFLVQKLNLYQKHYGAKFWIDSQDQDMAFCFGEADYYPYLGVPADEFCNKNNVDAETVLYWLDITS